MNQEKITENIRNIAIFALIMSFLTYGSIITDHGNLTGLLDNDHPQYTLNTTFANHTHEIVDFLPNSMMVYNGTLLSGNYTSLYSIDNNGVWIQESLDTPAIQVELNFSDIVTFENILITGRYDGSHYLLVEMWNHNLLTWDTFGIMYPSTVNLTYSFGVPEPDVYINGNTTMRLTHVGLHNVNNDLFLDKVVLRSSGSASPVNLTTVFDHLGNVSNPHNVNLSQIGGDNTKVNKSGDIMTGNLVWNKTYPLGFSGGFGVASTGSYNSSVLRFAVGRELNGTQVVNGTDMATYGYFGIITSYPEAHPGFYARGLRFRYFKNDSNTPVTFLTSNEDDTTLNLGNFSVTSLAGSGNAYACIDSSGKIYRSATACV